MPGHLDREGWLYMKERMCNSLGKQKRTGSTIEVEGITLKRSRITSFKKSTGTMKGKIAACGSEW